MPKEKNVTPDAGYVAAGRFNPDVGPKKDHRESRKSGLGSGGDRNTHKQAFPSSDGVMVHENFTTDTDMSLLKNYGKSGKY